MTIEPGIYGLPLGSHDPRYRRGPNDRSAVEIIADDGKVVSYYYHPRYPDLSARDRIITLQSNEVARYIMQNWWTFMSPVYPVEVQVSEGL